MEITTTMNNTEGNITYPDYYDTYIIARNIQKYSKPVICLLGFIGNFLSAAIFLSKSQRKTSCSLYLGARSLSDTGFLVSLFCIWLGDMRINAFKAPGMCQSIIFLSYVCAFLSVWFIVMVTFENYIRICMPFQVNSYCTTKKAKIVISIFILISFIIYNFTLWTTNVKVTISGMSMCEPFREFEEILQYLSYVDTFVTLIFPTLITIVLMLPITLSLLEVLRRQARLTGKSQQNTDRRPTSNPQSKVTKLLFSVSLTFILLSLPSHVVRLQLTISKFVAQQGITNLLTYSIKFIFETVYYLSFSINIMIYLVFGDKFRNDFKTKFSVCCKKSKATSHQELQTLNSNICNDREEVHTLLSKMDKATNV